LLILADPAFADVILSLSPGIGVSYDPNSFGLRFTLTTEYRTGFPTQEICGDVNPENVTLVLTLPAGTSLVSETDGRGVFDPPTRTVTWNLGTLDSGTHCFGTQIATTIDADSSIPAGTIVEAAATISTTTPGDNPSDNQGSGAFQVGLLPLQVSVTDADTTCYASASGVTTDSRASTDGTPVVCSAEGDGGALGQGLTDTLFFNPFPPNMVIPGPVGEITSHPSSTLFIGGVGVHGKAFGSFVLDSGGTPVGTSAGAEATMRVRIELFNPNPYPVDLRVILDVALYAAAGNEAAIPPFPGSAYVEDSGPDSADAGSGVATEWIDFHLDLTPAGCRIRETIASTRFPILSGPDPALDPVEPGSFSETDQTLSPSSCFGGPMINANSSKGLRFGFGSDDASGRTSVTFIDDTIILVRSGYGVFNASESLEIMLAAGSPSGGARTLVITSDSPIDLLISDSNGRRLGFDLGERRVVNEISGGQYSGHGSQPQVARILHPSTGNYRVDVQGLGDGSFTVTTDTLDGEGDPLDSVVFSGIASQGSMTRFELRVFSQGVIQLGAPHDLRSFSGFQRCFGTQPVGKHCLAFDLDVTNNVDLTDFSGFLEVFGRPGSLPSP
jgi:hypothetical protein